MRNKTKAETMSISDYIKIVLCIALLFFIILFQVPNLKMQMESLEKQKATYEAQNRAWARDSIRKAHEIQMLDSALHRIKARK